MMYCPECLQENPAGIDACQNCRQDIGRLRERLHIGAQFVFVWADEERPLALKVDDDIRRFRQATILSRHRHTISFGDQRPERQAPPGFLQRVRELMQGPEPEKVQRYWPLPKLNKLSGPRLRLATVVSDRKIYRPYDDVSLLLVAPDAAGQDAGLELKLGGHKVYESRLSLDDDGLAFHTYRDLREGEYTAAVQLPDGSAVECSFSTAEFTLSPLVAILKEHSFEKQVLAFKLELKVLSEPYDGPAELGLQCQVCGDRVVATQEVTSKEGRVESEFDISGHGGPFHVQVTTPDGNTALVAFPGTGARERQRIPVNTLGQSAEMGLLPWDQARPLRGFYMGETEMNMTPLLLEQVVAEGGRLKAAVDLERAQILTFNPRSGESQVIEKDGLAKGEIVEFEVAAPYIFFTAGVWPAGDYEEPFEGWGVVIRPVDFEANVEAPEEARPGQNVDITISVRRAVGEDWPVRAACWLLVYDARLEHESPVPRLAKRIHGSIDNAGRNLGSRRVPDAEQPGRHFPEPAAPLAQFRAMAAPMVQAAAVTATPSPAEVDTAVEAPVMVMAPTRMEFPELAFQEFFSLSGQATRTVRLGDQIGTWRVRAYLFKGVDYQELTADIQAQKSTYAELDLPAIASDGDEIEAAVNYLSPEAAELVIATAEGETRSQVRGSGSQRFTVTGPGRVEVMIRGPAESDMTSRHIARPGVQEVTASRLLILDRGETASGERAVVYPTMGAVLKDTITALVDYPFG